MASILQVRGMLNLSLLCSLLFWVCCPDDPAFAAMSDEFEVLEEFVARPRQISWEPTSPTQLFAERTESPGDIPQETNASEAAAPTSSPAPPNSTPDVAADAGDNGTESLSRRYDGTFFEQLEEEHRAP